MRVLLVGILLDLFRAIGRWLGSKEKLSDSKGHSGHHDHDDAKCDYRLHSCLVLLDPCHCIGLWKSNTDAAKGRDFVDNDFGRLLDHDLLAGRQAD